MICFFKQKTAYEMRIRDWMSDGCSSDLQECVGHYAGGRHKLDIWPSAQRPEYLVTLPETITVRQLPIRAQGKWTFHRISTRRFPPAWTAPLDGRDKCN